MVAGSHQGLPVVVVNLLQPGWEGGHPPGIGNTEGEEGLLLVQVVVGSHQGLAVVVNLLQSGREGGHPPRMGKREGEEGLLLVQEAVGSHQGLAAVVNILQPVLWKIFWAGSRVTIRLQVEVVGSTLR